MGTAVVLDVLLLLLLALPACQGNNAHDYKFSSAVLEDYEQLSPPWRDRLLAASIFQLRGSGDEDNDLVTRVRAAFA